MTDRATFPWHEAGSIRYRIISYRISILKNLFTIFLIRFKIEPSSQCRSATGRRPDYSRRRHHGSVHQAVRRTGRRFRHLYRTLHGLGGRRCGRADAEGRRDRHRRAVHVSRCQEQFDPGDDGRCDHCSREVGRVSRRRAADRVLRANPVAHHAEDRHHLGRDAEDAGAPAGRRFLRHRLHVRRRPDREGRRLRPLYVDGRFQGAGGRRAGRHGVRRRAQQEGHLQGSADLRFDRRHHARRRARAHQGRLRRPADRRVPDRARRQSPGAARARIPERREGAGLLHRAQGRHRDARTAQRRDPQDEGRRHAAADPAEVAHELSAGARFPTGIARASRASTAARRPDVA
ncbi:hypothetical protein F01_440217 [Burkholderia cenocepacia]|nr:hypothetical protein F01_440217 [Burkholderia cenocepacia]